MPWPRGKPDSQSHVIRFECPMFNNIITRHTKTQERTEIQGKNKPTEITPEKDQMVD